jgi:23S rRNA-/tRNA-specific pseudouridylate synthase
MDDDLIVVDKPSGLPSQAGRDGQPGVIEVVHAAGGTAVTLSHCFDQPVSGLVVLAVSDRARRALADALRTHEAGRAYVAVLAAPVEPTTWERPLDGRRAVTHVAPLGPGRGHQPVRITLETGRTHQIRRHAALAGAPVVGDRRYGGEAGRGWPRIALHAVALRIAHPATGEEQTYFAALPADLAALWAAAGGPPTDAAGAFAR